MILMDFACRWLAKQAVCLRTVEGNFFLDNTMKSGALICICFTHFVQQCVHFAEKDKHKGVKLEHYLHKVLFQTEKHSCHNDAYVSFSVWSRASMRLKFCWNNHRYSHCTQWSLPLMIVQFEPSSFEAEMEDTRPVCALWQS